MSEDDRKEILGRGKIINEGNKIWIVRPWSRALISFSRKWKNINIFSKKKKNGIIMFKVLKELYL